MGTSDLDATTLVEFSQIHKGATFVEICAHTYVEMNNREINGSVSNKTAWSKRR